MKKVHYATLLKDRNGNSHGYAFAACSGWMKVPYTLLKSSVTCKTCRKMKAFKEVV